MNRLIARAALISCAAIAVGPAAASHSWGSYHWGRTSNPLKLEVNSAITAQWQVSVGVAIADWDSGSSVLQLSRPATEPSVSRRKCTAITGKVLVCNDSYGQRGWLGIATIWASGNHITKGTTKLNDSYFNQAPYNSAPWRALVACQEIGHDFGLAHQDEAFGPPNLGSCMDYTNDPDGGGSYGPDNEHPNAHDYAQLSLIYDHTDSSNTSATQATNFGIRVPGRAPIAPPGLNEEAGDSPAEWGRAVGRDGAGRSNLYIQDLGGGRRKITHVFWAMGEGPNGKHPEAH